MLNVGAGTGSYEPSDRWVLGRGAERDDARSAPGGERIPTPGDCVDGFIEAFWRRPEALLDPAVRASQSMWAMLGHGEEARIVERLRGRLGSGSWDTEHGHRRRQATFDGALRLVISEGRPPAREGADGRPFA